MQSTIIHPTVVSTFASLQEPTLKPKARKRTSTFPSQVVQRTLKFIDPQNKFVFRE